MIDISVLNRDVHSYRIRKQTRLPIGRGLFALVVFITSCGTPKDRAQLHVIHDTEKGTISVYEDGREAPLLVQHAEPGVRPYIHPIMAPMETGR